MSFDVVESFRTPDGVPYALILDSAGQHCLRLDECGDFLRRRGARGVAALVRALRPDTYAPVREVHCRFARVDGRAYLDLHDKRDVVEIGPRDWRVVREPTEMLFHRPVGMLPLPMPRRRENEPTRFALDDLRAFLETSDKDWLVILQWLVCAVLGQARPVLAVQTDDAPGAVSILRGLVDPAETMARHLSAGRWPNIRGGATVAFVSRRVAPRQAEALRDVGRPVIVAGPAVAIPGAANVSAVPTLRGFVTERPYILGGLLDAACAVLRAY